MPSRHGGRRFGRFSGRCSGVEFPGRVRTLRWLEFSPRRRYPLGVADLDKPAGPIIAPTNTAALPHVPSLSPTARRCHKPVFIVFLVVWAANAAITGLQVQLPAAFAWIEALLPVTAAATTLLALACRLPLHNVFMAGLTVSFLATIILAVGALTGTPFGPILYSDALGERIFGVVPWPLPLLWVVLIINARGVARLVMRPWRKTNFYGFWVIGIGCALVVLFAMGFEPFAVQVKDYYLWQVAPTAAGWFRVPWVDFLGWFLAALAITALSIPWLINKHPIKQPMDYQPLIVWLLLNLWPALGCAAQGLWLPVIVTVAGNGIAAAYAIRGARW